MELSKISKKKGQLSLGDAPTVVLLVGLVFLLMATFAFIGEKYGDSVLTTTTATISNETGAWLNGTTYTVDNSAALNFDSLIITSAINTTSNTSIGVNNFSVSGTGYNNATSDIANTSTVWVSYTYTYTPTTTAYNTTSDLQTELGNNTSIAGIVLTIALVGIVLTILIGVFVGIRRRTAI